MQNWEFREFALNEPNLFHYAALTFPRQFLVPALSRGSSTTTKRSPIALRAPIPVYFRRHVLHWSRQYANTFRGPWTLVQGARRATELGAGLDTSLGAILYSMLDAGHYVIFDTLLDAVFNPGLDI